MELQVVTITAIVQDDFSLRNAVDNFVAEQDWVSYRDTAEVNRYYVGEATCEDDLSTAVVKGD